MKKWCEDLTGQNIKRDHIQLICDLLDFIVTHGSEITRLLATME
jgi:predicted transcriptional regulator